ncbi:MAG: VanW family protein [Armatimonadota bacterium]
MRRIIVVLTFLIILFAAIVAAATAVFQGNGRICRDVTVSGISVGGLSRSEAAKRIEAWAAERVKRTVVLSALDARWTGTLAELGARVDVAGAVERAMAVGRSGNLFQRAICTLTPWGGGKRFSAGLLVDESHVRRIIDGLARHVDRPHRDARLRVVDGRLDVLPEGCGVKLNREAGVRTVQRALCRGLAVVAIPVEVDKPDVTAADAARIDTLLSRFTTWFNPAKRGRTHNLRLAANALNGIILKPGMQFSTNETIGPRLTSRGFQTAQIFANGRLEEGLGGGVCQVSSTLYNAVLLAGLKVLERSHHSRLVPYVPAGRDATVAYGLIDFRFQNTNSAPIGLITTVKDSRLTVDIYGSAADKKDVKVYTSQSRWIPAGTQTLTDPSLPSGVRKLVEKGSSGVSVVVYRKITYPDGKTVTEVVFRDRYLPQNAVLVVGSGPKPQQQVRAGAGAATVPIAASEGRTD